MPTSDDGASVTLQELGRVLGDFRHEMRNQLATLVRNDVYRAEQAADRARIQRLEEDGQRAEIDARAGRRMLVSAFLAAGGTFVASLVMFIISLALQH